ncbi:MAG: hypothetical protein HUU37_08735, partial [Bdellovibrionales bacterium]|nr:hypothetical protein [Bdellovibrionales bacterium]
MPRKIKYRFRDAILRALKNHPSPLSLTSLTKQIVGKQASESHHMLKLVDHELRHLVRERELERLSGGLFRIRPPKVKIDPAPLPAREKRLHQTGPRGERRGGQNRRPGEDRRELRRTSPNTIEGTISKNQRGFAFLKPSRPTPGIDEDIFLPPEEAEQLMSGDRVEVRLQKDPRGRGVIGSVTKILQRGL